MTVLEKFLHFAERLPAERLVSIEAALAEIMVSHSDRYDFSADELQAIDQRVIEAKPTFAAPDAITQLFGKPFSA